MSPLEGEVTTADIQAEMERHVCRCRHLLVEHAASEVNGPRDGACRAIDYSSKRELDGTFVTLRTACDCRGYKGPQ